MRAGEQASVDFTRDWTMVWFGLLCWFVGVLLLFIFLNKRSSDEAPTTTKSRSWDDDFLWVIFSLHFISTLPFFFFQSHGNGWTDQTWGTFAYFLEFLGWEAVVDGQQKQQLRDVKVVKDCRGGINEASREVN